MVESTQQPVNSAQILVVEDEMEIRELISILLLRQGHKVQQAASAIEALEILKKTNIDLIVLDWMLPNLSGIDFLKNLQLKNKASVLMLTAKSEAQDIITGLESGADDYITKPFEPNVFIARVKALLRRTKDTTAPKDTLDLGDLHINLSTYEVKVSGEPLHLTPSEFKIMATMGLNQGKVLTRDQLIEVVQGEGIAVTGRTIDTHVFGLRKKLGACSDLIETIRGIGYRVVYK